MNRQVFFFQRGMFLATSDFVKCFGKNAHLIPKVLQQMFYFCLLNLEYSYDSDPPFSFILGPLLQSQILHRPGIPHFSEKKNVLSIQNVFVSLLLVKCNIRTVYNYYFRQITSSAHTIYQQRMCIYISDRTFLKFMWQWTGILQEIIGKPTTLNRRKHENCNV